MYYLAIETSCDETSLALLQSTNKVGEGFVSYINSFRVVSSVISSQIKIHQQYGGVVPEIGARQHASQIHFLFEKLLEQVETTSNQTNWLANELDPTENREFKVHQYISILQKIDTIFVTTSPGLQSALKVGQEFAKSIAYYIHKLTEHQPKIQGINHLHGHVISSFYDFKSPRLDYPDSVVFPHLHVLVSGGNTQLILIDQQQNWQIIGQTLDDAVGECLDKTGRLLGLPYPAGVSIAKIAGLSEANDLNLPIGMAKNQSLNFSYSGLKTAVQRQVYQQNIFTPETPLSSAEIAQLLEHTHHHNPKLQYIQTASESIQTVAITQLINKFKRAITEYQPLSLGVSGGVSANNLLRAKLQNLGVERVFIPPLSLTGDNAVMIALSGLAQRYE